MHRLILTKGWYLGLLVAIGIVVGVQFGVNEWVLYESEVGQVTCTPYEVEKDSDSDVNLKMDCVGAEVSQKASTDNADVVVSWIKDPGSVNCTLYKRGNVSCGPRGGQ